MTTRGKAWREVLRSLIEDLKQRFVSDVELADRVWEAWTEWMIEYDHLISEKHVWELDNRWQTRPNLNSIPAELEWVAGGANSRSGRFWRSALLRKALEAFREQRRNMDWSTVRDLNLLAHYFGR